MDRLLGKREYTSADSQTGEREPAVAGAVGSLKEWLLLRSGAPLNQQKSPAIMLGSIVPETFNQVSATFRRHWIYTSSICV